LGGRTPSFLDLHREVNRLFDDAFRNYEGGSGQGESGGSRAIIAPRLDVHETQDGLELTAELAGVDQNAIEIRVDDDVITIKGEKRNERRDAKAHVVERSYGSFERSVQLPYSPDPEKVRASFENGLLKIEIPKAEQQDKSRRIQIGSGQSAEAGKPEASGDKSAFFDKEAGAANDQSGATGKSEKTDQTSGGK